MQKRHKVLKLPKMHILQERLSALFAPGLKNREASLASSYKIFNDINCV